MVKSVLSVSHRGLRDWVVQRVSAIFMALYVLWLCLFVVMHNPLTFIEWRGLFESPIVKIATILFLMNVLCHAWVGIWTIFTDYVKPWVIRFFLHISVFFMLMACFIWGVWILWSV